MIYISALYPDYVFDGFGAFPFSDKEYNVNCICLGENTILSPASNLGLINRAREIGIDVQIVELSEFWKGTGGPNCLIMPLERK